jgi:hypothetical protein
VHIQCNVHSWHTGRQQALSSNKDNLSLAETLLLVFISNLVIPVNATLLLAMMCKDIHVTLSQIKNHVLQAQSYHMFMEFCILKTSHNSS